MNREIKFRAWDDGTYSNDKGMVYFTIYDLFNMGSATLRRPNGYCRPDSHEIMQYTCRKDKYGNDIYQDDIVKYGKYGKISQVQWNEPMTGYFPCLSCTDEEMEILGNIYSNPQLLK